MSFFVVDGLILLNITLQVMKCGSQMINIGNEIGAIVQIFTSSMIITLILNGDHLSFTLISILP